MIEYPYNVLLGLVLFWSLLYVVGGKIKGDRKNLELIIKPFFLQVKIRDINRFIDKLVRPKLVRTLSLIGIPLGLILSISALGFLSYNLYNFFVSPPKFTGVTLLIPFVTIQNITLLTYFFISIPLVLIPHELAHALVARLEKIDLKGGGLALLGLLFAGFIEPDDEQFRKANPKKKMKILAAGSTANLVMAAFVFSLLLFQPATATFMPSALRTAFYGPPDGVYIYIVDESYGIGAAGARPGDVIKAVNGVPIRSLSDYMKLDFKPGETVTVLVDRNRKLLNLYLKAVGDGERGRLGFYGFTYYPPHLSVPILTPWLFGLLYWIAFLSLMVGMFNMLPLYPFDGDGFFTALFELTKRRIFSKIARLSLNAFTLTLFAGNLLATIVKMGFIVL